MVKISIVADFWKNNTDAIAVNVDCRPEHTQVRGKGDEESTDVGRFQENAEF
jgi:hypothetical protein